MSYKFYATSEKAFSAMFAAVQSAEKSIYWESYIFLGDTFPTHDFIGTIIEKAVRGVTVKIVIDGLGSYSFDEAQLTALRTAGAEVIFVSKWLQRIHRKILVVDHSVAFVGGVNVAKSYQKWLDLHMRLTNHNVIVQLLRSFARSYKMAGGTDPHILGLRKLPLLTKQEGGWVIEHWPWRGGKRLRAFYESNIVKAKSSITIVSPLLFPHPWLFKILKSALQRSVAVTVVVPKVTDPRIATIPNFVYAELLTAVGAKVYFLPAMNHAKVLIIDESIALVGSQNIDAMSFDFNAEVGLAFVENDMVKDVTQIVHGWIERSQSLEEQTFRLKWYHKPVEWIVRLIQPVI